MTIENNQSDYSEKTQKCQEYIESLEEERRKIQVFQRELPLCLELVTQAIEACKQQLSGTTTEYFHGQSECSDQTSTDRPVLEEFMPIKKTSSSDDYDDEEQESQKPKNNDKSSKKSDWLRSVQLWNQTPDPLTKEDLGKKVSVVEVKRNGGTCGAFHPFKREKRIETTPPPAAPVGRSLSPAVPSSSAGTAGSSGGVGGGGGDGGGGNKKEEKESQSQRKTRRCWSPELHRRFLQSLQQLGGSQVATPKQIRELMNVDGLTNDEVKSHLQKYRLHTRRPSSSMHNNNPQAPQFVVVGGIWVPPQDYATMATKTASEEAPTSNGIYTPIATLPPGLNQRKRQKLMNSDERGGSRGEGGVQSNSPATSSSTHTTTASPPY